MGRSRPDGAGVCGLFYAEYQVMGLAIIRTSG